MGERFDRNIKFFGAEGQAKLRATTAAVVGVGGLGTHVVQQLALLGVGGLVLVDHEELDETNLNRYVGARATDRIPGTPKVDIGERTAIEIDPAIRVTKVPRSLLTREAVNAVTGAGVVFGCLDRDGVRLFLTELTAAYELPYFDLATEINPAGRLAYGGRVCASVSGDGCPMCLGELDVAEAQRDLAGAAAEADRRVIYGVEAAALGRGGPSVASINGVVASLGITEFLVYATGVRSPNRLLKYYGHAGKVTVSADKPNPDCYYCCAVRGTREKAGLERYFSTG